MIEKQSGTGENEDDSEEKSERIELQESWLESRRSLKEYGDS
jgi:hypothetical protein